MIICAWFLYSDERSSSVFRKESVCGCSIIRSDKNNFCSETEFLYDNINNFLNSAMIMHRQQTSYITTSDLN